MKKEEEKLILKSAILEFGFDNQLNMLIEECSELIVECCKLKRGRDHNLNEEIADVLIMIEQIMMFIDADSVASIKEQKLIRLQQRVNDSISKRIINYKSNS